MPAFKDRQRETLCRTLQGLEAEIYLACLRALWVELHLLGCELPARVHVVAQVHAAEGALAQQLPPAPVHGSTGSWQTTAVTSPFFITN